MADFYAGTALAGPGTVSTTNERNALLGPITWYLLKGIILKSSASDAGNTPTTECRHGLLLGKVAADGFYEHYQPNVATGQEVAEGFLFQSRSTIDTDGNAVNRTAQMVVAGWVRASDLLLLDQQARAQMFGRFIFDDLPVGNSSGWQRVIAKAEAYTVTVTDNNTTFTNLGATAKVVFTLPAIAKGLRYRFYSEDNDGLQILAATADTLVVHNDVAADSVEVATTGRNIGAGFEIIANSDATKWLVIPYTWNIADDGSTTSKAAIST